MKFKTTKRAIMANNTKVYSLGYCDLQDMLRFYDPMAYTSGVYGWNADIYQINGIAIVTGYRPFGKVIDYNLVKEYKEKARILLESKHYQYEENKKDMQELMQEFCKQLN